MDIQSHIDTILQALVGLFVIFIMGAMAKVRTKLLTWLETRTTAAQREILHRLAGEAMALAETSIGGSRAKLVTAIDYVNKRAKAFGIEVNEASVRAAVEKAVLDYNATLQPKERSDNEPI